MSRQVVRPDELASTVRFWPFAAVRGRPPSARSDSVTAVLGEGYCCGLPVMNETQWPGVVGIPCGAGPLSVSAIWAIEGCGAVTPILRQK